MACIMPAKSIVLLVVLAGMSPVACWNPPVGYVPGSPKLSAKPVWPSAKRCSFGYGGWPKQGPYVPSGALEQFGWENEQLRRVNSELRRKNSELRRNNSELSAQLYVKELEIELLYAAQRYTNEGKNETENETENESKVGKEMRKEVQSARWLEDDTFIVLYKLVQDKK